jgi:pyridoxal phosphate enzyme (YggS family)
MFITYEEFARRADAVRARISEACALAGRGAGEVELLPVTKTHPPAAIDYIVRYGLRSVGENRVQEAVEKRGQASAAIGWELIGHLQTNKAGVAVRNFDRIQSVDREKLLATLDAAAGELGRILPILLQINAGNDPAKFGAAPADADRLLEAALARPHLRVEGLMTIPPLSSDWSVAQRTFENLREIRDRLKSRFGLPLGVLSMGMSGDMTAAIAAGSTQVRIGRALFGSES